MLLLLTVMASGATATPAAIAGVDVNGDGALTSLDVSAIVSSMGALPSALPAGAAQPSTSQKVRPPRSPAPKRAVAGTPSSGSAGTAPANVTPPPPPPPAPEGWTTLTPGPETRIYYVSATGSDANAGTSEAAPLRTLAAAYAKMRPGKPDWMLLKRGDVFTQSFGHWTKSGRSITEPMVISSYGSASARPLLRTGTESAFSKPNSTPTLNFVSIVGLAMTPHQYTGGGSAAGVHWVGGGEGILVEDCEIIGYTGGVIVNGYNGTVKNFRVRRSVIADCYNTVSHSQGIYMSVVDGILIQENVIDHNGWREGVTGAHATIFNHNIYLQNTCSPNTQVIGNIIANASSHGVQLRGGGLIEGNLFIGNPINILLGSQLNTWPAQGTPGVVQNNVVIDSRNISNSARGHGIWLQMTNGAIVQRNLVAHQRAGGSAVAFNTDFTNADVTIRDNKIVDWSRTSGGGSAFRLGGTVMGPVRLQNNYVEQTGGARAIEVMATSNQYSFAQNRYFTNMTSTDWFRWGTQNMNLATWRTATGDTTSTTGQVALPDTSRDVAKYHRSIGGAESVAAFMTEARKQSKQNWRPRYTAESANQWIRAGYGMN